MSGGGLGAKGMKKNFVFVITPTVTYLDYLGPPHIATFLSALLQKSPSALW